MSIKKIYNYSPNFNPKKRKTNHIKFLVFHYTGMKNEKDAIKRLTDLNSKVSSHYVIKNNGEVIVLVPDLYVAWHAGKSSWKNFKSLNSNSIGIEISNPGHYFNYKKYSNKQINSLLILSKFLIKKYRIKSKNILGHSDIAPDRKKDPGEKFPWSFLAKNKVGLWHSISKKELKNKRKKIIDTNGTKKFFKNLIKIGYLNKKQNYEDKLINSIIEAFQRRYRQELVNGELDKECLIISENIANKSD